MGKLIVLEDRPRDTEGKFVPVSKLAKKIVSVRLFKESYARFLQIAEEMGKPPTILAREILEKFIAEYKNDESDSA